MPTVLVVDDEANIRELVTVYLTAAGFDVLTAEDGPAGLELARGSSPDLVVLDIMLPGLDGTQLCRAIRETSRVPIVMLTARDTDLDKVALLEAGADDYVTKPFSPPELIARIRAVLRRTSGSDGGALAGEGPGCVRGDAILLGGLAIDSDAREVRVDGAPVALTAKEFDLLHAMARDAGVVFTRERLLEVAWGFSEWVDARGVDVHVRHIREKLGDDAASPRFVETVRGVGYRVRREAS